MSKYRNTVYYDFKSQFLVIFLAIIPAPSSVENIVSLTYIFPNLEKPYSKSSFPVHWQIQHKYQISFYY